MLSWTGVLFVLCCGCPAVLCCDWLESFNGLNAEARSCLRLMGGEMTKDQPPLPFPFPLYSRVRRAQVETQLLFLRDSLQLIFGLYRHDNLSSAGWDAVKTEHFLIVLDRQIAELSHCVAARQRVQHGLRRYYGKLRRKMLRHTGGSAESWELLRMETKLHLDQLELLANVIRAKASRGRSTEGPPPRDCSTTASP